MCRRFVLSVELYSYDRSTPCCRFVVSRFVILFVNETVKLGFIRPGRPCKFLKLSRNRGIGVEHTKRSRVARACTSPRLHEAWVLARIFLRGGSLKQETSGNPERRGRASRDKASRRCFDLLLFLTWLRGELIVHVFCLGLTGLLALLTC